MHLPFLQKADNGNVSAKNDVIDTLARTLYGEARGENVKGIEAVACVVLNRVKVADEHGGKFWWGSDVQSVCRKPWQFSCWNENDPNRLKIMRVTQDDPCFAMCLRIARRAVNGLLRDFTEGSTHYHTLSIEPKWAVGQVPLFILGNHAFYRLGA